MSPELCLGLLALWTEVRGHRLVVGLVCPSLGLVSPSVVLSCDADSCEPYIGLGECVKAQLSMGQAARQGVREDAARGHIHKAT